jgi:hypothetical protein
MPTGWHPVDPAEWVEQVVLGNMPNVAANLQDVYKERDLGGTNDRRVPTVGHDRARL